MKRELSDEDKRVLQRATHLMYLAAVSGLPKEVHEPLLKKAYELVRTYDQPEKQDDKA
jgi:hypothetical protein